MRSIMPYLQLVSTLLLLQIANNHRFVLGASFGKSASSFGVGSHNIIPSPQSQHVSPLSSSFSSFKHTSPPTTSSPTPTLADALSLRGGADANEYAGVAYDWCINLGAPAALVAGAVIATLYENIREGALEVQRGDTQYVKLAKKITSMLLLSAFALQVISIFVTTVCATMLLSRDFEDTVAPTALAFLREQFEFEYLTARLSFLQGLLNWLGAVAVEHTIPRGDDPESTSRKMDRFVASSMMTCIVMLITFYDAHLTFYKNYGHMVAVWMGLFIKRFFFTLRPMMIVYLPGMAVTLYTGVVALLPSHQDFSAEGRGGGKKD